MSRVRFDPAGPLRGAYEPPPDKSISHRAALFAALADGPVAVTNYLDAADTRSTLAAVRLLGARVEQRGEGRFEIHGVGLRGPRPSAGGVLDVGNSGTLLRLLPGWLAGQPRGRWTFDGDESIRRRPVDRVVRPLRRMGARIEARDDRLVPMTVHGAPLRGIEYELPVASAQVKSCVLLAGLLAEGRTTVVEGRVSRDHTERILARFGAPFERDGLRVSVGPVDGLALDSFAVPGDPSSAAFMVAAAALVPGSRITVRNTGLNWTRCGFFRIAARMGAQIAAELERPGDFAPEEPVGELEIGHGPLVGTTVAADEVPAAIDELTLVALLGAFAAGETVVRGAEELRYKESDRIAAVVDGLRALGADIEATDDGFAVRGDGSPLRGGTIDARGDHRIAMLGAVAGLASREGVEVVGMDSAAISYPGFVDDLGALIGRRPARR